MTSDTLQAVLAGWFLTDFNLLPSDSLYGSPERTIQRYLIEDKAGSCFILDQIPSQSVSRKLVIAENLDRLHQINPALPIHPYQKNNQNLYIAEENKSYWMCSPFIPHQALDRLTYWQEEWRGLEMAEFLKTLRDTSQKLPQSASKTWEPPLHLYIPELARTIQLHNPDKMNHIEPIILYLQPFLTHYPTFPVTFCHGDFHPLNILWSQNSILGVIDWEFSGYKPRLYDIANMLGCIGMENPEALAEPMIVDFIQYFFHESFGSVMEWQFLVDFILSNRFGWIAEWFRKQDTEMIDLEITYMEFLMQYHTDLLSHWGVLRYITGKA